MNGERELIYERVRPRRTGDGLEAVGGQARGRRARERQGRKREEIDLGCREVAGLH